MIRNNRRILCVFAITFVILLTPLPAFASGDQSASPIAEFSIELNDCSSIDWNREDIVSKNLRGIAYIQLYKTGLADLSIEFYEPGVKHSMKLTDIPVEKHVLVTLDDVEYIRFNLNDPAHHTFASIDLLEENELYVYVATYIDDVQLSGQGFTKDYPKRTMSAFSGSETALRIHLNVTSKEMKLGENSLTPTAYSLEPTGTSSRTPSSSDDVYFLVHYDTNVNEYANGYHDEIASNFVIPFSYCTKFVKWPNPIIAQVKEDLNLYSWRTADPNDVDNYIGLYQASFHGIIDENKGVWVMHDDTVLKYSDIRLAWWIYGWDYSTPLDTIVLAACCHSLHDEYMARAFTDFGAACYIGSVPELVTTDYSGNVPWSWNNAFLSALAKEDMTVSDAIDRMYAMNNIISDEFTFYPSTAGNERLSNADQTEPSFPDDWIYRRKHTLEGSGQADTDYQVKLTIHYGPGYTDDDDLYLQRDGASYTLSNYFHLDFDDIRFTLEGSTNPLSYWRESTSLGYWYYRSVQDDWAWCENTQATFWIKIPESLSANNDVSIYVYYGESSERAAETASDGDATFLFFDDFENNNFDRWDTHESAWSTQSSIVKHGSYAAKGNAQTSNRFCGVDFSTPIDTGVMFHSWVRVENNNGYEYPLIAYESSTYGGTLAYVGFIYKNDWATHNGAVQYYEENTVAEDTWYRYEVAVDFSNRLFRPSINGISKTTQSLDAADGTRLEDIFTAAMVTSSYTGSYDQWQDDFYIRKYVHDEPDHGGWGEEELWGSDDWGYSKTHTMDGSVGAGENYQIRITAHFGNGNDGDPTGEHVFLNYHCQPDFDDIRFTDDDGILYDHWKESYVASNEAVFWVEVKGNLDSSQDIIMYYGNSGAASVSDGTATFIFFDDFDAQNWNKWTIHEANWESFTTNTPYGTGYAGYADSDSSGRCLLKTLDTPIDYDVVIHSWSKFQAVTTNYPICTYDTSNLLTYAIYSPSNDWATYDGATHYYEQNTMIPYTWHELEIGFDFTNGNLVPFIDGIEKTNQPLHSSSGADVVNLEDIGSVSAQSYNRDSWIDDFYVRKWIRLEPTHGSW